MLGVSCDPNYLEGTPDPDLLLDAGIRYVRMVSMDRDPIHAYVEQLNQRNIVVWADIARESGGYILPAAQIYQIGNEPDLNSPSSWTRTPQQYHDDWDIYWGTWFAPGKPYSGYPVITAGMASGLTQWFQQMWNIGPLQGCSGVAVHPYAKTPLQARDLINAYKTIVGPNIPAYVSECSFKREQIAYARNLFQNTNVVAMCHFPWTSIQNNTLMGFREDPVLMRLFCAS